MLVLQQESFFAIQVHFAMAQKCFVSDFVEWG